jgi:polyphosphate kinase
MTATIGRHMATARIETPAPDAEDRPRYLNRELSTLDFQERVLALAEDPAVPLLERAKFLAIVAGNLDELYGIRVAGLRSQAASHAQARSADGLTAAEQLDEIAKRAVDLSARHAAIFRGPIRRGLSRAGVHVYRWRQLRAEHRQALAGIFHERIFPALTPLAVDPGHPFPYISDQSLNLAVVVADAGGGARRFARIKVPPILPRFLAIDVAPGIFVPLEDVIAGNLAPLFPGMRIVETTSFRVTRSADIELDDEETEDLLEAIEDQLRRRRFRPAVRLEIDRGASDDILNLLLRELQLTERDVVRLPPPLGLVDLWSLYAIDRPDLKDPVLIPSTPAELIPADDENLDPFRALRERDIIVHHPYQSFTTTVQAFIEAAAADPSVLAIKQTLYRTSGESPIVDALVAAAAAGKQVVVMVEIKARGDEPANIGWARMLERAGCHVVYGMVGLKTHAKLCLVVRQEGDGIRRYVHIGTGNYNPTTARTYEDIGLLTADDTLAADVSHLFNLLTGYSRRSEYERLIVAPLNLRRRMIEMIDREVELSTEERPGWIAWKVNALTDEAVIDALYRASQAGVRVDLIVRSICSLRAGVPGLSAGITVRSIVGRFLEHSRIYCFGNGGAPEVWIGSADMMHRNLDRRVETLVRVDDPESRARLIGVVELAMADAVGSWQLGADGTWTHLRSAGELAGPSLQDELQRTLARRG